MNKDRVKQIKKEIVESLSRVKNSLQVKVEALKETTKAAYEKVMVLARTGLFRVKVLVNEVRMLVYSLLSKMFIKLWSWIGLFYFNVLCPIMKKIRLVISFFDKVISGCCNFIRRSLLWTWNLILNLPDLAKDFVIISIGLPIYLIEKVYLYFSKKKSP